MLFPFGQNGTKYWLCLYFRFWKVWEEHREFALGAWRITLFFANTATIPILPASKIRKAHFRGGKLIFTALLYSVPFRLLENPKVENRGLAL